MQSKRKVAELLIAPAMLVGAIATGARGDETARQEPRPPGHETRVDVTRDTWFSSVGREADCNLGGAAALKLKSIQEMSLIDIDPAPLKGHVVRSATLHLKKRGDQVLRRVTVSSFASPWVEG